MLLQHRNSLSCDRGQREVHPWKNYLRIKLKVLECVPAHVQIVFDVQQCQRCYILHMQHNRKSEAHSRNSFPTERQMCACEKNPDCVATFQGLMNYKADHPSDLTTHFPEAIPRVGRKA